MELASLIISVVSLVIGIVGFIITINTWRNTKSIDERIAAYKIKLLYPVKHPHFIDGFEIAQNSLEDGLRNYYIVSDLLKICRKIQMYYDNWDEQYIKVIDEFIEKLIEIPSDNDIDESTRIKLQDEIYHITAMLERIGDLNDIGEI